MRDCGSRRAGGSPEILGACFVREWYVGCVILVCGLQRWGLVRGRMRDGCLLWLRGSQLCLHMAVVTCGTPRGLLFLLHIFVVR